MAHPQQRDFVQRVKELYPDHFKNKVVVEFGSLNLNGTVRDLFEDCDYTGVDIIDSKIEGVDVVSLCHEYTHPVPAHTVISCEMLEHDGWYKQSLQNMFLTLKSGGLLIITAATLGRKEHGTNKYSPGDSPATNDYYKNISMSDVTESLNVFLTLNKFDVFHMEVNRESHDIYLYAIKK